MVGIKVKRSDCRDGFFIEWDTPRHAPPRIGREAWGTIEKRKALEGLHFLKQYEMHAFEATIAKTQFCNPLTLRDFDEIAFLQPAARASLAYWDPSGSAER